MKAINYACFKLEVLKRKENNFINAIRDKFAMILKPIWLYKPFSVN